MYNLKLQVFLCKHIRLVTEKWCDQAPENSLAALTVLGDAWQSQSYFERFVFLGAANRLQKPGV